MCFHGTLNSIPYNLLFNTNTFSKKMFLTFWSHLEVEGVCKNRICACIFLYVPFPLI